MDRPHGFYTQAAATQVLIKQERSADNGWSSYYKFRGGKKISYFKSNSIFAQGHDAGRLFDTGLINNNIN
jgi:hypothetical protein